MERKKMDGLFRCSGFVFEVLYFYGYYDDWRLLMTRLCKETYRFWKEKQKMFVILDERYKKDTGSIIKVLNKNGVVAMLKGVKSLYLTFPDILLSNKLDGAASLLQHYELRDLKELNITFKFRSGTPKEFKSISVLLEKLFAQEDLRIFEINLAFSGDPRQRVDLQQEGSSWNKIWNVIIDNLVDMKTNCLTLCNSKIKELDEYFWVSDTPIFKLKNCCIELRGCKFNDEFKESFERHNGKDKTIIFDSCKVYSCRGSCYSLKCQGKSMTSEKVEFFGSPLKVQMKRLTLMEDENNRCRCINYSSPIYNQDSDFDYQYNDDNDLPDPFMHSGNQHVDREYNRHISRAMRGSFYDWY
ncbi:unnamed protein product [Moneuplotes crassus]|uniref:Uncharacterized protein n=1 Tax=Euplotes crassus TaxID=5936 RepID=A0AAD1XK66_EUPCR|nr:unnamed protein product [Moneuplotes crassus]